MKDEEIYKLKALLIASHSMLVVPLVDSNWHVILHS